jgi:3'-phosphoadenosine 5'-phosphosulfate (PAPS) 3'-phosphatase
MYEREKLRSAKKSAKNQGARERESANTKARNLRPKKERESASVKSSAQEHESASAKRKKRRVPSSVACTKLLASFTVHTYIRLGRYWNWNESTTGFDT